MAYIGQGIKQGTFKVLDTSGNTYNGSNTTFNLGTQVGSAAQLLVSHDGVIQLPGTDYTLATGGTQITFSTAPASGASIFITEISGAVGGTVTPSDASVTTDKLGASSVTTAKLGADAVTEAKIADDAVESEHLNDNIISGQTALGATPADTDEFLVSDAGTIKRVDYSYIKGSSTIGGLTDVTVDKASVGSGGGNFLNSILIDPSTDGSAPNLNAVSGNANNNYGIGKDTFSALTTGIANTAIGEGAGKALTSGYSNVIIGGDAGDAINTGAENVTVGVLSGSGISSGSNNVMVGRNSGNDLVTGSNNICIGSGSDVAAGDQSNGIALGPVDAAAEDFTFGNRSLGTVSNDFNSDANFSHSSDERLKKNIQSSTIGLAFINELRPITYQWKPNNEIPTDMTGYSETNYKNTDKVIHGFIAQEVKAAIDKHGDENFSGWHIDKVDNKTQRIKKEMFIMPIVKAIQELSAKIDTLETENTALKARVTTLEG
jgi:hypothetical protein